MNSYIPFDLIIDMHAFHSPTLLSAYFSVVVMGLRLLQRTDEGPGRIGEKLATSSGLCTAVKCTAESSEISVGETY